ncbi:PucR family transcriptional regulator [Pseudonocardia sp. HH130630-07]|uniref:PucR family transcriptional regulator n=1 Tax=Pseudonocardia sp. HH130630-07 TaxID=1690815 RepID=UPI0018D4A59A|nr:helix-turn-helix domain-containing protein [Pseudonocardia sp. HH130630-07]
MQEELRAVAEGLAARLRRAVAIDDPEIRLLVHTAHDEDVDDYRVQSVLERQGPPDIVEYVRSLGIATSDGPVRIPGMPGRGMLGRACVPIRCDRQLLGYLWLIDDAGTLTDGELRLAADAAAAAGQLLHRQQLLGSLRDSRDRELLRDLVSDNESVRTHAAAELARADVLPADGQVVAIGVRIGEEVLAAVDGAATELDLALQRGVRHLVPLCPLAMSRSGGHGTVLVADRRLPPAATVRSHAEELQSSLARALDSDDVRVGIGPVVAGLPAAHRSAAAVEDVLRVTDVVPGFGPVVSYEELGIYRLLVHLPIDELPVDAVPAGLRTLMERDTGGQLVETLETYLDEAGDARASVARLHVHRGTLYYRLSRIEEISGMRLGSGGDRLALHLGLKLARLIGPPARP